MWLNRKKQHELDVFRQEVLNDPTLERRFVGCNTQADAVDLALALAQQRGYRFSRIEFEESLTMSPLQEMSDADLAQVGGGNTALCDGGDEPGCAAAASVDQLHQQSRRRRLLSKD